MKDQISRRYGNLDVEPVFDYAKVRSLSVTECFGLSRNQYRELMRCRKQGWISFYQADHLAAQLGVHPTQVWGDDWWRASAERELNVQAHLYDADEVARRREYNRRARARQATTS
jgi:hypothetical protein